MGKILVFGTEMKEVIRKWRKLNNEELHNLYLSPDVVWVNKSSIRT
jgi:hypothetical protein